MLRFQTFRRGQAYTTQAHFDKIDDIVCECKISVNSDTNTRTISSWYTAKDYQHHGYGTETLRACLNEIKQQNPEPAKVEYIWNGTNEYVLKWLAEHFGAISRCPVAVQKYAFDDDWESHIYVLNKEKFAAFFS